MKVVLDTNVLISALISPHNPPDLILQSWLAGGFELLTSEEQLEEVRRVSRYKHLQPFLQPHKVGLIINRMRSLANTLVTGDHRAGLLDRKQIGATEILTATQFAERYLGWHGSVPKAENGS